MRRIKGIIVGALALLVIGCGGNASINRAHIRFLNLVPEGQDLDFYVKGTRALRSTEFTDISQYGLYDAGSTLFAITRPSQPDVLASLTDDVQEPSRYTVVAVGKGDIENQPLDYALVLFADRSELPDQTTSVLRIANASPSAGAVDVYVTEPNEDINSTTPTYANLGFAEASLYGNYAVGSERIRITPTGSKSVIFDTTLFLSGRQIRTLYLRDVAHGGLPVQALIVADGG